MQETHQATIDDLNRYTVAIQETKEDGSVGRILGTGVIVTDDGLILTCYHVVGDTKSKTINHNTIDVYFPDFKVRKSAQIVKEYSDPSIDVAFFKIEDGLLPQKAIVSNLGESIIFGHKFASIGFRKSQVFEKLSSSGEIRIKTSFKSGDGTESPSLIQLYSDDIESGMSGAPVLDLETNRVIGIISEHWVTSGNVDTKLNFAIPVNSIIENSQSASSILKEKNSGLRKFNNFIQLIGKSGSFIHQRFEDVYVAPIEYDEIEQSLRKQQNGQQNRCVFITGSAEYGKTYTAIKLLWEYYKKDYAPKYIEEGSKETNEVITKLVNQDKSLENNIIYIEDPVGKTEYTRNKQFEESIETIIAGLGHLNTYLVVTMREEIYQEFNPIGKANLKKYIKKMNIANHSYDSKRRMEMLCRWATVMNCKWFQDDNLRKAVLGYIEDDETKLPTPLNIKDFTSETVGNGDFLFTEKLLEMVNKKSQRTPARFAQDIIEMEEHHERYKVLFLCFPFISDWFSTNFVEAKYTELLKDLNIKDDYAFKRARAVFKDKIEFSYYVRFSHPSYSEALPYLLLQKINDEEEEIPTKINDEIFSNVLIKLHADNFAASGVARTIASNFDKFSNNVRDLLFVMADDTILSEAIAEAIQSNFDKLPSDVSYKLLMSLISNDYKFWDIAQDVANSISLTFNKLPENVRDLLFKMADNNSAAMIVSRTIVDNFDLLPEDVRNELLVKLADKKDAAAAVANFVANNFDKVQENVRNELLVKLADKEDAVRHVASALVSSFDKVQESVRNELLVKLADKEDAARGLADTVANNFDKLPEKVQDLLVKIADNKYAAGDVAYAVAKNFDKLPEKVQNLLFRLADNNRSENVAWAIVQNFDKLPENVRNQLLLKLADNEDASAAISSGVSSNFDLLPEDVRNELLIKLAYKKDAVRHVASVLVSNFDKVPENVRNEMLVNKDAAAAVANFVANNFDKLPENVRNGMLLIYAAVDKLPENARNELLVKLADNEYLAGLVAKTVANNFDKVPENARNELLVKLAEYQVGYVAYAVAKNFDKLPEKVQNLLFRLADNNRSENVAWAIVQNFDKLPENVRNQLLLKLADNEDASAAISSGVSSNFDLLPEDVRNELLIKLAGGYYITHDVAMSIASNFNKLPETIRNELLIKLIVVNNHNSDYAVVKIILSNFDSLPRNVKDLLSGLAGYKGISRYAATVLSNPIFGYRLPADLRNMLLEKLQHNLHYI